MIAPLDSVTLPASVRARHLVGVNGLTVHVLESGFEEAGRPCVLLLHGFPELAYSWRKLMLPLAKAGFHVVAPDQRGYGRTTGWDSEYDGDLASFRMFNLVQDIVALVEALGRRSVAAVVGHDFGSFVAAWCALTRPDVFRSVALMSAPFAGPPPLATGTEAARGPDIDAVLTALAALPRPRKHYQWYFSTREANADMRDCPQGIHAFLRAYFHFKSADWPGNQPFRLASSSAEELAKMPTYYIMDLDKTMAETVAPEMPAPEKIAACRWLPDDELAVYSAEFARTGFQGGLQWYRCGTGGTNAIDLQRLAGRTIDVPACFIAGRSDWGVYQKPGEFEAMQTRACTRMLDCHLVDGAGHWVQQEQPEQTLARLVPFLLRQVGVK